MQQNPSDNEISVVPFRYKYLKALLDLLESNNFLHLAEINMKTLPKIGYMALLNGHPIAAGFLRRVEGGYAQIDTLTSAKHFGSKLRHQGIEAVLNQLIEDANDLDLKGIIAFTEDDGILARAEAMGFHMPPKQRLIALKLRQ